MAGFTTKMALKEMAEEDIYFAKRDRELIEALHRQRLKDIVKCAKNKSAKRFETQFREVTDRHKKKPKQLAKAYRKLLSRIRKACIHKSDAWTVGHPTLLWLETESDSLTPPICLPLWSENLFALRYRHGSIDTWRHYAFVSCLNGDVKSAD